MSQWLREQLIGAWEPASFTEEAADCGEVRATPDERPDGLIMYMRDGYLSAQLP
jgi:hypothetical protein